ncbi:MAG: hypothetical protein SOW21_04435 [[Actinobacillus] rossii]|nr:hypothetical protein [[Actinobacillus] rossii]
MRSAVIFLSKFGFTYDRVEMMCHAELNAWMDSGLLALGGRSTQNNMDVETTHYVFTRRKKTEQQAN